MPIIGSSAYSQAGDVSTRMRAILNDSEVVGGDVLTDSSPFTFELINAGYERVQLELAKVGVEVAVNEAWIIGLPITTIQDPEARMILDDTGCNIIYPSGVGNVFSLNPQLPVDLILPLQLWERQTATTNFVGRPMLQSNSGLLNLFPQTFLIDWEWKNDGIRFRGATQSQDIKMLYEKHLPKLITPTDPVPIRGVLNAAAYFASVIFTASRGGSILDHFKGEADAEIFLLQQISARRRQRKQVRRQPYTGRGGGMNNFV